MTTQQFDPEIFKGKNFDERVEIRRGLIAKYGTSLPAQDQGESMFGNRGKDVVDAQGNVLPKRGDSEAFENKTFDERVQIRQKMIAAYGSSLPEADEENHMGGNSKNQEDSAKSNFANRVNKRKVIAQILDNPSVSALKKKDIRENKDEYIEDPNIFIEDNGDVKYITTAKERKRVVYEYMPSSKLEIDKEDHFNGSWGASLSRAKKMTKNHFPVFHIPWRNKKEYFATYQLDEVEAVKSIISDQEFHRVRF
jgi:hypothetical protein